MPPYAPLRYQENGLIDGGHRVAAARQVGLNEVPCLYVNGDTRRIYHAIRCNEDGADTQKYDVFDYAELCWRLGNQKAQEELGWSESGVIKHKNIKTGLHPQSWKLARLTNKFDLSVNEDDEVVSQKLTIVNWSESHFRVILSHLGLNSQRDNALMRAQLKVIREAYKRASDPKKKVTIRLGPITSLRDDLRGRFFAGHPPGGD